MKFEKAYLDNRELSWLKFNQRVLEEAEDESVPLFERLRFSAIFCSNLDEFFMIRVGSLWDQTLLKKEKKDTKTNLTAKEQLHYIAEKLHELIPRFDRAYEAIMAEFLSRGYLEAVDTRALGKGDIDFLEEHFKNEILPLLSPSIIDKNHPVQFLKNNEIYIGTILKRKEKSEGGYLVGVVPASSKNIFDRVVYLPQKDGEPIRFVLVENLILHFLHLVFKHYDVQKRDYFRITRNADIDVNEALYDQDVDFRGVMEELLKKRKKLAPVRIEFGSFAGEKDVERITSKLNIDLMQEYIFIRKAPLDMSFVEELEDKFRHNPELFNRELKPQLPAMIRPNESIMKQMERGDILLSYPYEKFSPFINLLEEAARNPDVVSIKITLYRVARGSKIVEALIMAAENGIDVLALVELRARFDEENNIGWSKRLEEAGVQVIYGLEDLKVHSKLLLITKKTRSGIRYYIQVGTGNYNERTSKLYTDFTLMTCDQDIGADASTVFNSLSVGTTVESTNALWVAPRALKSRIIEMIDTEIAHKEDGYIGIKVNSLTDKDIIEKFVEASKKGVRIELLVRGICCLVAGVAGETENITVTSVVGRLLEHSRIYIFGKGERQKVYISSADFMTRNTERRVEVAAPIRDKDIREEILFYFNSLLKNNIKARTQNPDGSYTKQFDESTAINTQEYFYEYAERCYHEAERKWKKHRSKGLFGFIRKIKKDI